MNKEIGKVTDKTIKLLSLDCNAGKPILLGDTNIEHMKKEHLDDYNKYGKYIEDIISNPTYVSKNPRQGSIEYIKEFENNQFVLVAVRETSNNYMFARTLFTMTDKKKEIYLNKGFAKKY